MNTTRRARREARRLYRACLVDGLLDQRRALQVVERVAGAHLRGTLAVLTHFRRLVELDRARHRAVVESATPLPFDLHDKIEAGIARAYGPGVSTDFAENPALIGGMRVKVGSDVYDGSVRAALHALSQRF
ncbi:MAG TPA: F0F1 ATP synthase subunit delta [Myxococcales bacterium]|nr:F0F1 ATP synthase subunit delta [Myxococcales bacterium]